MPACRSEYISTPRQGCRTSTAGYARLKHPARLRRCHSRNGPVTSTGRLVCGSTGRPAKSFQRLRRNESRALRLHTGTSCRPPPGLRIFGFRVDWLSGPIYKVSSSGSYLKTVPSVSSSMPGEISRNHPRSPAHAPFRIVGADEAARRPPLRLRHCRSSVFVGFGCTGDAGVSSEGRFARSRGCDPFSR